ncbi:carbohydrate ABC transporter permease [Thermofilum pendens]|uniref:Binding-protein-dependent transport systems inner membrane component n=1 Tax=Thermofilum pendens (strain DSM 2475 / Hrk 5) TaxID=368408 RepID=A1RZM3_THEPD|nr:carbohydrate ABC transporter permease [Thermofilum pendens]ABL78653.1 binding-protein-dependent transport systems inner membrane component [Thermofilum pendens Hrk 5]
MKAEYAAAVLLLLLGALWAIPLYALVAGSLKNLADAMGTPVLQPPSQPDFGNVVAALEKFSSTIALTGLIVLPAAFAATLLGSLSAFAIRLYGGKVADWLPVVIALTTYIPYQAIIVPLVSVIRQVEVATGIPLYDTSQGLFLVLLVYYTPMATLLMFIFSNAMPREPIEASLVDGAGLPTIYWRVALPLLGPGFVSTLIFLLINMWNNLFIPLSMTRGYEKFVTLKIFSYVGQAGTIYNEMFAAALIGSLPPLVVFLFMSKYFIRGMLTLTGRSA